MLREGDPFFNGFLVLPHLVSLSEKIDGVRLQSPLLLGRVFGELSGFLDVLHQIGVSILRLGFDHSVSLSLAVAVPF
ncbi:hypothetical protein QR680_000011 [Steinernema hermaphroditum]|uniref:Uncharacterized protein n=1 Tax=Steinernema hermaphroditum TaxID=289476 RepID=A0AA39GVQ6_9BILA|nr:hypothetical protein QR680_000011 [Steinernema hermaphroditum]